MSDEKQIQGQAPEQADPKYKETLLLYNENNHAVQAVSDLRHSGNDYQVVTTQPVSENKPAFFHLKDSSAAAAFIAGFKSQKDKDNFRFLRVAADKVCEVVQALHNLTNNPKDEAGLKALREHTVTSYQLDKVKFDTPDLHLHELQQMGIIVTPQELEAMKLGLPTKEIHDLNFKLGNMSVVGQFALSPYRDNNDEVQIGLQSVLARPEYEREEYKMVFSTSDKETLAAGRTLDRLVELPNPHTGEKEWCHVGLNRATNRFVTVPHREVNAINYFNDVRLTDAQKEIAMTGGRFRVEECQARNINDLTYSGTVQFDVFSREYRMTDYTYSRPYIPQSLDKQLDDRQRKELMGPNGLDCSKEKEHPILGKNGKPYSCILRIDPKSNGVVYDFSNQRRQEQEQQQSTRQTQDDEPKQSRGRKR